MLARVHRGGLFELLTAASWTRALGYLPEELARKSLRDLMPDRRSAGKVIAALVDEEDVQPLEVTLQCKDRRRKRFRLYRRFDPYDEAVFVVADDVSDGPLR